MDLSTSTLLWNGLTVHGRRITGDEFTMTNLDGWEDLPDTREESTTRPYGHGVFDGPVWSEERVVTVTGRWKNPATRDARLAQLQAAMVLPSGRGVLQPLTITHAGRTLTAWARLRRFRPSMDMWGSGTFGWSAQWLCPDPLRYAAPVSVPTGFARDLSGLRFPLFTDGTTPTGVLTFGDPGTLTGMVELANVGTVEAWPVHRVLGPVPAAGFEIVTVETGERLRFEGPVPDGSTLTITPKQGLVTLDGVDRLTSLTVRDWAPVPPGDSRTFHFRPLGGDSTAVLTVELASTYW